MGGKLYVLNEKNNGLQGDSELRLVCLDPLQKDADHKPKVIAVQTLGVVQQQHRITHDMSRRLKAGDPQLPEAIEQGTRVIVEEVNFLKSLVDEFSRFARLPEMRPEPTDLPALARSAVRLFEGAREGIAIEVESRLARPNIVLDPGQIKRALINLIDNALEACGTSGQIAVRCGGR